MKRMAKELEQRCNAPALQAVTLVLGGLAQLWMHADTFARDDDTLDISLDEIDEITGIEGFGKLLPAEWLEVIDPHRVKLPDFQAHNGSDAKRKAQTAKRVAHHRNNQKRTGVTPPSQPVTHQRYQTRPDQTRPDPIGGERSPRPPTARRLPEDFELTEQRRAIAITEKADPDREFAKFRDYWRAAAGQNARKHDWDAAWRNWCRKSAEMVPRANGVFRDPENTGWRPTK